ncbi:MAG: M42 family metallopeptidase [Planctomycetota bacterium]|nr:M42 family metallopeptidase [Planctomycetota bacterium]
MELLKRLTEAFGVAGFENEVRSLVKNAMKEFCDEVRTDVMGNVIGYKKGKGRTSRRRSLMLCAHIDEIGFLVTHIDDNGFLRVDPVGGVNPKLSLSQRVIVCGRKHLFGVIGSKPIHILTEEEMKKQVEIKDMFIDVGLPKDKVKELVSVGDPVAFYQSFFRIGNHLCCKAMDDRVGVYVMLESLKEMKKHEVDVYAVASTQEEVGLRGAVTSAFGVDPSIGIALDTTLACDVPDTPAHQRITELGKGVAIKIKDTSSISNPLLVRHLKEIAEAKKIPYQMEILPRGGTDAGAIQRTRAGVPTATLSIPTRYVHSVVECVHEEDVKSAVKLIVAYAEKAHEKDYTL